jgi:hypothetical protein
MNVLVIYQSRSGHTRQAAEAIAQTVRDMNHEVKIKSVIEVRKADVDNADALFVGTWVQGFILFGVKPAGAELWVPSLPSLDEKPTGIFCTHAFNPRGSLESFARLLTARGARVVSQRAFHRNHLDNDIKSFVVSVLQSAEPVLA